jgi:gluconolactonase
MPKPATDAMAPATMPPAMTAPYQNSFNEVVSQRRGDACVAQFTASYDVDFGQPGAIIARHVCPAQPRIGALLISVAIPLTAQRGGQPQGAREVTVSAMPGLVSAGSRWMLAWQGTDNADGIIGTDDGGLLFAQEQPNRISKLDANDKVSVALEDTHGTGAIAIDARGRVLAVQRTCTDPGGQPAQCTEPTRIGVLSPERKVLADSFDSKPLGRLNDLVADKKGGVYFTVGGAYYVNTAGRVTSLGENIRANGIMLSPDERVLYVTNGGSILAFDVQADGGVTNRRDFATLEAGGNGDGMAIDAAGRLYVTSQPGVQVFDRSASTWD